MNNEYMYTKFTFFIEWNLIITQSFITHYYTLNEIDKWKLEIHKHISYLVQWSVIYEYLREKRFL